VQFDFAKFEIMKRVLLFFMVFCGMSELTFSQINWVDETGFSLGDSFVDDDTLWDIGNTGLNAVITVNTVSGDPEIDATTATRVFIRNADNASFTLTFLNGTADITLENYQNLLDGEEMTVSNPDGSAITITETSSNGGARMSVDGVSMTGSLPSTIVEDATAVMNEHNTGAGTSWNASMSAITSFTWLYNAISGISATEGFELTINAAIINCSNGPGGVGSINGASNLKLWLKADTEVENASSDPAEDGDDVSTWYDLSGYDNDAISVASPDYQTSQHNGFPSVHFTSASSEYMNISNPGSLPQGNTARSYFIVAEGSTAGSNQNLIAHGTNSSGERFNISNDDDEVSVAVNGHRYGTSLVSSSSLRIVTVLLPEGATTSNQLEILENGGSLTESTLAGSNKTINTTSTFARIGSNQDISTFYEGDISEVIVYDKELNDAELIIVHNYLSAKYNIGLDANDIYDNDDVLSENYDYEVAGIGRVDASNMKTAGKGSAIVCIHNATDLGDDEFMIWGHDNGALEATEETDIPIGESVEARLDRVWRVSEVNSSGSNVNVGDVDMSWDLTTLGSVSAADLRLLIDTDNDGEFDDETVVGGGVISGAISLGSNIYEFVSISGTDLSDNRRFTIATINQSQTPLPIDLLQFNARKYDNSKVQLEWETSSEMNNDYFTIERTIFGENWDEVDRINGAGNSTSIKKYKVFDYDPIKGESYYRLKQTDFDGSNKYFDPVSVNFIEKGDLFTIHPNPTNNSFQIKLIKLEFADSHSKVDVKDLQGRVVFSEVLDNLELIDEVIEIKVDCSLDPGVYFVSVYNNYGFMSKKLIVN
jgi:hypothetical protein